ncbi:hypothetical protein JCM33374_g6482 [Metschnikowia sp. JCM 33374]|nr:hypothetical protein JCM33374_g6482 [Metschnikowia sp. JCM 33374]
MEKGQENATQNDNENQPLAQDSHNSTGPFVCGFCGRNFSRKGTYGRHLDSKKGDIRHPADRIEELRGAVVRRAVRGAGPTTAKAAMQKVAKTKSNQKTKSEISKKYNSKDAVKEKNKARRKERDLRIKAQLQASEWYVGTLTPQPPRGHQKARGYTKDPSSPDRVNSRIFLENATNSAQAGCEDKCDEKCEEPDKPDGERHGSSFPQDKSDNESEGKKYAYMVASYVPPSQWPSLGEVPGDSEFSMAIGAIGALGALGISGTSAISEISEISGTLGQANTQPSPGAPPLEEMFEWHAQWAKLQPERKLAVWQAACDRALRAHLHGASLRHISEAGRIVQEKSRQLYEEFLQGDFLGMIFTDSEGEN